MLNVSQSHDFVLETHTFVKKHDTKHDTKTGRGKALPVDFIPDRVRG